MQKSLSNLLTAVGAQLPDAVKDKLRKLYLSILKSYSVPSRYLLILGHMRSGSTLLLHILNSNPELIGFGETKLKYVSRQDLDRLLVRVAYFFGRLRLRERYAIDKMLQNCQDPDLSVVQLPNVFSIILLREPTRTLPSLRSLNGSFAGISLLSEQGCLEYYIDRLAKLESFAQGISNKSQCFFLTYGQLVDDTENTFRALESWLNLKYPLKKDYDMHAGTGIWGMGDGGANIKSGTIVRAEERTDHEVSAEALAVGKEAFERCCSKLRLYCTTVDDVYKERVRVHQAVGE